jgi:hypothetical protein
MDTVHGSGRNKNGRSKEDVGANKIAVLKDKEVCTCRCVYWAEINVLYHASRTWTTSTTCKEAEGDT